MHRSFSFPLLLISRFVSLTSIHRIRKHSAFQKPVLLSTLPPTNNRFSAQHLSPRTSPTAHRHLHTLLCECMPHILHPLLRIPLRRGSSAFPCLPAYRGDVFGQLQRLSDAIDDDNDDTTANEHVFKFESYGHDHKYDNSYSM